MANARDLAGNEDGLDTTAKNKPPSPSTWDVPSWLTRASAIGWRVLVTVAFGALVVAFAIYLSTVTLSILFAVIAVATLGPFNERLRARGWGGAKAAGGSIGAAVLIVVGALLLIGLALIPFLVDLAQCSPPRTRAVEHGARLRKRARGYSRGADRSGPAD